MAALAAPGAATADDLSTRAKFLYQLTKYVTWPDDAHASPDAPIVIGVVDDELLRETIASVITNKRVRGRSLAVVAVDEPDQANVHLLFLSETGRSALRRLAHQHQDGTVLTVAEDLDFPNLGGDVGIDLIGSRISFSINRRKVTRGDFRISSKLMRLASEVK